MSVSGGNGTRDQRPLELRHLWVQTESIVGISRVVADLERSESFYRRAMGFQTIARAALDPQIHGALGLAGEATELRMRLGAEEIALVQLDPPVEDYPAESRSNDLWFQHLAIVVSDMTTAYGHLRSIPQWQSISIDGPQTLPGSSGGVQAFKFRDPDGHPLELLWMPPGQGRAVWHGARRANAWAEPFLGIDHSALSVSSTRRSLAFYRGLGLQVAQRSVNGGPAQSRLDGLEVARLRVTGLRTASVEGPGIELLAYRPPGRPKRPVTDLSTDWITLRAVSAGSTLAKPRALADPDGHRFVLQSHGALSSARP